MELKNVIDATTPDRASRADRPDPVSARTMTERQELAAKVQRLEEDLSDRDRIIVGMSRELVAARTALDDSRRNGSG